MFAAPGSARKARAALRVWPGAVHRERYLHEADPLQGKRTGMKTAHDRYANHELSYFLQRMERFDGLTILALNLRADIEHDGVRTATTMRNIRQDLFLAFVYNGLGLR